MTLSSSELKQDKMSQTSKNVIFLSYTNINQSIPLSNVNPIECILLHLTPGRSRDKDPATKSLPSTDQRLYELLIELLVNYFIVENLYKLTDAYTHRACGRMSTTWVDFRFYSSFPRYYGCGMTLFTL